MSPQGETPDDPIRTPGPPRADRYYECFLCGRVARCEFRYDFYSDPQKRFDVLVGHCCTPHGASDPWPAVEEKMRRARATLRGEA